VSPEIKGQKNKGKIHRKNCGRDMQDQEAFT
jgi:hypothetical protein